jgi:hypothetical protein
MAPECDRLADCGFFRKYSGSRELACKSFIITHCKGPKQSECKRKEYIEQHGDVPPDDMMPSGDIIKT